MKKRKCLSLLLIFAILIAIFTFPATAEADIKVMLNGTELNFDVPPRLMSGRTMVPMRVIFEALGADVHFIDNGINHYYQEIVAVKNNIKLSLAINREQLVRKFCADFDEYYLSLSNHNPEDYVKLDVEPQIISGRMLVPLRAVSESLGVEVEWNAGSRTVFLSCDESFIADKNRDKTFYENYLRYKTRPCLDPKPGARVDEVPELGVPAEIQELAQEIYNEQNLGVIMSKIVEKFGEPEDEGGNGFPIPVWKLSHGKITFMMLYGVFYESNENICFLTSRSVRFGDTINCALEVFAVLENNASSGIGTVFLKANNTYVFDCPDDLNMLSDTQKKAFFIHNKVGSWEIKFVEGHSYDTDVGSLAGTLENMFTGGAGTKIAEIVFTGANGDSAVLIVNVPEEFTPRVTFNATALGCEISPHVARTTFTSMFL